MGITQLLMWQIEPRQKSLSGAQLHVPFVSEKPSSSAIASVACTNGPDWWTAFVVSSSSTSSVAIILPASCLPRIRWARTSTESLSSAFTIGTLKGKC